ncbi:hypothetical protein [Thermosporothrix hazakensis]|uniref:Uncharacterized protein n=1 Tax=Thermosporothrix sp. COM3 TaxID=2490863 RepID=A0A455SEA9_9CHLR|nr:hypothetical protein [Thermosporothrix hazakensis]BBH85678.1 hypothetical protein KTC_04290 [Thermosporothrix sp. COM3]GCE45894.1 hypothetical protein KTH_07630 [Thermosporothrix hazakensis]
MCRTGGSSGLYCSIRPPYHGIELTSWPAQAAMSPLVILVHPEGLPTPISLIKTDDTPEQMQRLLTAPALS